MEFLKWVEDVAYRYGLNISVYYSSITDWCITIGFKATNLRCGEKVVNVEDCDLSLAFAKTEVELKEWLLKEKGGY